MSFKQDHELIFKSASHFTHLVNHTGTGIWEFNLNTHEVKWSDSFYKILGYEPGEIECSNHYFYEHLLYHDDHRLFTKAINARNEYNVSIVHIRLLTKNNGYQWFENTSRKHDDGTHTRLYGAIVNIHEHKLRELQSEYQALLFNETGKIAKIAIWELEVSTMVVTLSKEGYGILGLGDIISLSNSDIVSFFEPAYRFVVSNAIENIIRSCKAFDLELPIRTARNQVLWVRFKAIPIIDAYGRCVSIRGILQDIDQAKKREITLQSSLSLANDQTRRLQNFAYIVSHNLRSHTGNLQFMVDLFSKADSKQESDEAFGHIKSISESLTTTVKHLEEVVKIQAEITKERKLVSFESIFNNIVWALENNISESGAQIEHDFSKCPEVNYIPAYLESILQNLLTNAIKYKHPDRRPVIKCYTYKKTKHIYLIFEDNGIGIDMARYGDEVFGMYKTFHQNTDSKGIGLFITRNQVESLGGSIRLESEVNVGTKFTIRLV